MNKKYGILLVLTVVFFFSFLFRWGYVVSAEGDMTGPAVTDLSPRPEGVINTSEPRVISFKFNDSANLDTNVVLQVDGQSISPTVTWDDLFEPRNDTVSGSTYDVRVGEDYTKGSVTAQLPQLSPGQHAVYYNVKDGLGNVTEASYTFTLRDNEGPQISEHYPADGDTVNITNPTVTVKLIDASSIVAESVYINIDGNPVEATYDVLSSTVTYIVTEPLSIGAHSIQLIASDVLGNTTASDWTFTVSDTPTIPDSTISDPNLAELSGAINASTTAVTSGPAVSEILPVSGTVTDNVRPVFSLRFNAPNQLNPSVVLKIDNQSVTPTITWDSIYQTEYDSCGVEYQVFAGYDYTNGVISAQLPQLSQGQHTIYYNLKDGLGNVTENSYTFTISDTQGPQATNQSPGTGATIADPKPVITAKLIDTNTIIATQVAMKFNGSPVAAVFNPTTQIISYQVPQPLKNGTYPVEVTATDMFGNTSVSSWSFIINDNIPPAITNLVPANNGGTASTTPVIEAAISDPSGIVNPVYLRLDGNLTELQYNSQTGKVSYLPVTPLSQGQHTVNMSVYDSQGNKANVSWIFTVRTAGPTVSELTPPAGSVTNVAAPLFRLRFNDPYQLNSNVLLKVDNQAITPTITWDSSYQTEYDSCGVEYQVFVGYDYSNGVITAQLPQLSQGQHTIYYNLKDGLGNVTENSYTFTISDTQGPYITNASPEGIISAPKPVISAKVTDENTVIATQVSMKFNGSPVAAVFSPTTQIISYPVPQPLRNGTYPVEVTATDIFGNITVITWSFTVNDVTPPVISNMVPANNGGTAATNPVIEASISDPSGIINPVYLQLDGNVTELQYNPQTGKVSYLPVTPLNVGQHTVNMSVYDSQGNKANASWVFTVYRSGPTVSQVSPAPWSVTDKARPVFSLRFNTPYQLNPGVILKVDNQTITPAIAWDSIYQTEYDSCGEEYTVWVGYDYSNGVISAQLPQLSQGQHTISYNLKDSLGNVTENNYTFTVSDTQGPQLTEQYPGVGAVIADAKPVIRAKVTDANTVIVAQVSMKFNGSPVVAVFNPVTSFISYTVPQTLRNGTYPVEVTATDMFGNTSVNTWSFTVNDNTPPTITNIVPANNSGTASTIPVIEASISDPSGIVNPVYLQLDGNRTELQYNAQTGKVSYLPVTPLSQGQHTVNLAVYDFQGNKASTSWAFTVRTAGPTVSALTPPAGSITAGIRSGFSFRFEDPYQVNASVILKLDNQSITPTIAWDEIYQTEYDSCGVEYTVFVGYDYTKGTVSAQLPLLSQGQHTIYYNLKDSLGNVTENSYNFTVSDTQGPQIIQSIPAAGAVLSNAKPAITAKLSDANIIVAQSVYLTVNGAPVNSTYNAGTQTAAYQPLQNLINGLNTIQVRAVDELGNISENSWSFTVSDIAGPQFSALTPAANTTLNTGLPVISAKVTDENGIDGSTVSLALNGNTVGSFNPINGIVSYTAPEPLVNGKYTVAAVAYDAFHNKGTVTWTFNINDVGGPQITNLLPPPMMGIKTTRPTISAKVTDNGGIDFSKLSLIVDGIPVNAVFEPVVPGSVLAGVVYAVPETGLSNGMHTATITVYDRTGNMQRQTWQFGVNTLVDMVVDNNCTRCHTAGAAIDLRHSAGASNCDQCHNIGVLWDHGDPYCGECHGGHSAPPVSSYTCTACHNSNNPGIPAHNPNAHNYTALGQECLKCHSPSLTREHNVYVEGRGYAYTCATCHQSSDPKVTTAISSNNSACSACHQTADHNSLHISGIDPACADCHDETLTVDHLSNRPQLSLDCSNCHNDATPIVSNDIYTDNKLCSQCHSDAHGAQLVNQVQTDIPLYTELKWSSPVDTKIWADEAWMPQEFLSGGKLLISERSTNITGDEIWNYYRDEMANKGWILESPAPPEGANFFDVSFVKNTRKVRISFYGGENHTAAPAVSSGCRVEILYK